MIQLVTEHKVKSQIASTAQFTDNQNRSYTGFEAVNRAVQSSMKSWIKECLDELLDAKHDQPGGDDKDGHLGGDGNDTASIEKAANSSARVAPTEAATHFGVSISGHNATAPHSHQEVRSCNEKMLVNSDRAFSDLDTKLEMAWN
jgi:hypothetical protein